MPLISGLLTPPGHPAKPAARVFEAIRWAHGASVSASALGLTMG